MSRTVLLILPEIVQRMTKGLYRFTYTCCVRSRCQNKTREKETQIHKETYRDTVPEAKAKQTNDLISGELFLFHFPCNWLRNNEEQEEEEEANNEKGNNKNWSSHTPSHVMAQKQYSKEIPNINLQLISSFPQNYLCDGRSLQEFHYMLLSIHTQETYLSIAFPCFAKLQRIDSRCGKRGVCRYKHHSRWQLILGTSYSMCVCEQRNKHMRRIPNRKKKRSEKAKSVTRSRPPISIPPHDIRSFCSTHPSVIQTFFPTSVTVNESWKERKRKQQAYSDCSLWQVMSW